jgi:hypothetical protein
VDYSGALNALDRPTLTQQVSKQMMISQRRIPLESCAEWKAALEGIKHAFAHTWENCHAMHLTTGFRTYLYCFETENVRIVCPIAEREFEGYIDIVTPYGFSGFVGTGDCANFPQYWQAFAKARGYVCGYIGLNPIFENKTYFDSNELYSYNNIYVLDLTLSSQQLFLDLYKNRQRQLQRWEKTSGTLIADKTALADFFLANYSEFFRQKAATSAYAFQRATLEFLFEKKDVFLLGAGRSNRLEAATLFTYTSDVADALLHVAIADKSDHSAALLWHGARHFKSLGIPLLNLGGGVRANDSLAWFKERFGGRKMALSCLKQIYDPEIYADLCARTGANPADTAGYFPAYRSRGTLPSLAV